jgi:ketosteroid isomerase-like protein
MTDTATRTAVSIVKDGYQAFGRADIPAFLALLDPQVVWTEAAGSAYAGTFVGHDALVQGVFMRLGGEWETFLPKPVEFFDCGETVIVIGSFEGTHRSTGNSMTSRFAHLFRLRGEKIVEFESINDTHEVRAAMT